MRKFLWLFLLFSVLMISCAKVENKENMIEKIQKTFEENQDYSTEVDMTTTINDTESVYKIKESYSSLEDKYTVEIIDPLKVSGIIIEYEGDKILLKHASINEYISLKTDDTINKGLLFGQIIKDRNSIISVREEKLDDISYYVLNIDVKEKNQYTEEIQVWLHKKDFKPYILNIIDKDNKPRVIYKYINFEFLKG